MAAGGGIPCPSSGSASAALRRAMRLRKFFLIFMPLPSSPEPRCAEKQKFRGRQRQTTIQTSDSESPVSSGAAGRTGRQRRIPRGGNPCRPSGHLLFKPMEWTRPPGAGRTSGGPHPCWQARPGGTNCRAAARTPSCRAPRVRCPPPRPRQGSARHDPRGAALQALSYRAGSGRSFCSIASATRSAASPRAASSRWT